MLFLHASPNLYTINENGKPSNYMSPQLDFVTESKTIKQAIDESHMEVIFRSKVATKKNFADTMSLSPSVLHISCHGVQNRPTNQRNFRQNQNVGNFLLFENGQGDGELVSAQELSTFMEKDEANLSVVFVAACQSEEIGRIFQDNGAKHVICVESKRFVLDKAAIMFTKKFYFELFSRREYVCKAFDKAKNYVEY